MNRYAASALKFFAYTVAALVILLAVAVGLLRLMLPELPEYREEIRMRASAAIGLDVEFERIDARWRLSGPELIFQEVTLTEPESGEPVLRAQEVSVGAAFLRMLRERRVTIGRIAVTGTSVTVERTEAGEFILQGRAAETGSEVSPGGLPREIRVVLEDVDFTYRDPRARGEPLRARLTSLEWNRSDADQELEARLQPGSDLGESLRLAASRRAPADGPATWDVYLDAVALDLERIAAVLPGEWPSPRSGIADLELWASLRDGTIRRATANVQADGFVPAAASGIATYGIRARIEWALRNAGWLAAVNELRIERDGALRPDSFIQISAELDGRDRPHAVDVQSGYLNMADLRPLAVWMPARVRDAIDEYDPTGELTQLAFRIEGLREASPKYSLEAEFRDAGIAPRGKIPGVRRLSGSLRADDANGRLVLDSNSMVVDAPALFAEPLAFRRADATIVWRGVDEELSVLCDRLVLKDDWLATESSFELDIPRAEDGGSPRLDLTAQWRLSDLSQTLRYIPVKIAKKGIIEWVEKALVAGRAEAGSLRFDGRLADFPFDDGSGVFQVDVDIRDAIMRYALQWPDIQDLDGEVSLDGMRLVTTENSATTLGTRIEDAYVAFEDLRKGILTVRGSATGSMSEVVAFGEASPISRLFGGRLADIDASGPARVDLDLTVPVTRVEDYDLTAVIEADGAGLSLAGFPHPLTDVSGRAEVTRSGVRAEGIQSVFLGSPMVIDVTSGAGGGDSLTAAVAVGTSRISAGALTETAGIPLAGDLAGEAEYRATVRFPKPDLIDGPPVTIRLESSLEGLAIALPEPLRKPGAEEWPLSVDIAFPGPGRLDVTGYYGQTAKWILQLTKEQTGWILDRGNVHMGPGVPKVPTGAGLYLTGTLDRLRLGDWLDLATGDGEAGAAPLIRSADVTVADLYAFGQRVRNVEIELERNASDWLVQSESPSVAGSVIVPTKLDSGRPLVLDLERLHLLEADPRSGDPGSPANYPPLEIRIGDFRIGERSFGAITADFRRDDAGLFTEDLVAEAETFSFTGRAGWRLDLNDSAGQRSWLAGTLSSDDVKTTLRQLGYSPGINADAADVTLDLSISGPPRADFLSELDGEVSMSVRNGQLDEVEPGAGRVFGLMSVAAIPRRLALDFRDVFNKGLGFDEIDGTFRIVNGDAYTCDLTLKGSVADIGVVGRAGLAQRDYNQTAVVSANVGGSLPAVGAVVAGPQAAAALLLFSQIFKKPLQELGQAYYQVSGDFDTPVIERTDAKRFAASSELAGCLSDGV